MNETATAFDKDGSELWTANCLHGYPNVSNKYIEVAHKIVRSDGYVLKNRDGALGYPKETHDEAS